jgi:uncharacterized membrane protein SirB2
MGHSHAEQTLKIINSIDDNIFFTSGIQLFLARSLSQSAVDIPTEILVPCI